MRCWPAMRRAWLFAVVGSLMLLLSISLLATVVAGRESGWIIAVALSACVLAASIGAWLGLHSTPLWPLPNVSPTAILGLSVLGLVVVATLWADPPWPSELTILAAALAWFGSAALAIAVRARREAAPGD
jgi:hydrogenase/urease accessory protein HupE